MIDSIQRFKDENEVKKNKLIGIIKEKEQELKKLNEDHQLEKEKLIGDVLESNIKSQDKNKIKDKIKNIEDRIISLEMELDLSKVAIQRIKVEKIKMSKETMLLIDQIKDKNNMCENLIAIDSHMKAIKTEFENLDKKMTRVIDTRQEIESNIDLFDEGVIIDIEKTLSEIVKESVNSIEEVEMNLRFNALKELYWQRQFLSDVRKPIRAKRRY
ncbi:hypothetical protein QJR30_01630 [Paraclostridium sordellii]|uniref:hypothetical protein n=1 Tax=Paraclostridium sordellii TaxID=1505 RepID=UPI0030D18505